jgi:preprotein translocase subunit SecY
VLKTLANAWKTPDLKKKMIFTMIIILLYRLGSNIPVPYVNALAVEQSLSQYAGSIFDYLTMLSGSGFAQANLFALSVSPYITAQIVIQLLTIAIPALEKLSKEGEEGRQKINKITRIVTIALSLITAYGYYNLLSSTSGTLLTEGQKPFGMIVMVACYCAGASLVMWLAEKIDDKGIGNGVSMILFVNILSSGPQAASQLLYQIELGGVLNVSFAILSVLIMLAVIVLVVFITNSERRIPVQYAKRVVGRKMYGGQSSNLPLKLNMAGVMPIIFASSIVALPGTIDLFVSWNNAFWNGFVNFFSPTQISYVIIYLLLIVAFAYFYISISFNTVEVSNNLKKNGGFVPGIRPGRPTADYIKKVLNRVTLIGALFLIIIAGMPLVASMVADGRLGILAFGGSSLLIVVGVALETVREIESQLAMRHYKGFLE